MREAPSKLILTCFPICELGDNIKFDVAGRRETQFLKRLEQTNLPGPGSTGEVLDLLLLPLPLCLFRLDLELVFPSFRLIRETRYERPNAGHAFLLSKRGQSSTVLWKSIATDILSHSSSSMLHFKAVIFHVQQHLTRIRMLKNCATSIAFLSHSAFGHLHR